MRVYLSTRQQLTLESGPFAGGGQGSIYRFDASLHRTLRLRVAKILKPQHCTPEYEARIEYLCAHRPSATSLPSADCLAWPEACLYDRRGRFIGFTQPLVRGAIELEPLCTTGGNLDPRFAHFDGSTPQAFAQRLRVARSLVDALAAVEFAGEFVSTDLKPQNIMVKPTAEVALIDLDNLQICERGAVLFRSTGFTDEFCPPEFFQGKVDLKRDVVDKSFERFSLAVILYRLLFRIHPFMGAYDAADLLDAIRRGYFAGGPNRGRFSVIPPPHGDFDRSAPALRQLFVQALDDGTRAAQRPSAAEWAVVLAQLGAHPTQVSPKHARAAWAAQRGIPVPSSSLVTGWERASIWNPYPAWRTGYRSPHLYVEPAVSEVIDVEDPIAGGRLRAHVHDIWLVFVFQPMVVGKRVELQCNVPPGFSGVADFAGEGWLGRTLPANANCVRDIYATQSFHLDLKPRTTAARSTTGGQPVRLTLLVEVTTFELRTPAEPTRPLPVAEQHGPSLHPVPLRAASGDPVRTPVPFGSAIAEGALRQPAAFSSAITTLRRPIDLGGR